eukprot:gene14175-20142_t
MKEQPEVSGLPIVDVEHLDKIVRTVAVHNATWGFKGEGTLAMYAHLDADNRLCVTLRKKLLIGSSSSTGAAPGPLTVSPGADQTQAAEGLLDELISLPEEAKSLQVLARQVELKIAVAAAAMLDPQLRAFSKAHVLLVPTVPISPDQSDPQKLLLRHQGKLSGCVLLDMYKFPIS